MNAEPVLRVRDLEKHYVSAEGPLSRLLERITGDGGGAVRAVDGVSFEIRAGETLGLVGESGCGKSTVARTVAGLLDPTGGSVEYRSSLGWIDALDPATDAESVGREIQMVFQDPGSSLNPRSTVGEAIRRPLRVHGLGTPDEQRERVHDLLERVGLSGDHYDRHPHELSGGQCQRVAIARALAPDPSVILLDEPTSALDVSVQAQLLNLLKDIQAETDVAYLFISHDLSVVRYMSTRVGVMYLGALAEVGTTEAIYRRPHHPYTISLLASVPNPDPTGSGRMDLLSEEVPSAMNPPSGCRFHTRCPAAIESACRERRPELRSVEGESGHAVSCHLAEGQFDAKGLAENVDAP